MARLYRIATGPWRQRHPGATTQQAAEILYDWPGPALAAGSSPVLNHRSSSAIALETL